MLAIYFCVIRPKKKKAKTSPEPSAKQEKIPVSPKRSVNFSILLSLMSKRVHCYTTRFTWANGKRFTWAPPCVQADCPGEGAFVVHYHWPIVMWYSGYILVMYKMSPYSNEFLNHKRLLHRPGNASLSKAKGTASKSGRNNKSKDDGKVTSTSKPSGKSEDNTGAKLQDSSKKTGSKSFDDTLKSAMKSKDVDGGTKSTAKSKQETPKTAAKSKGKTAKSSGESNTNGLGKAKSSSAKGKETEDPKGKTGESAKATDSAKGKSTNTSKSGNKRKKRS